MKIYESFDGKYLSQKELLDGEIVNFSVKEKSQCSYLFDFSVTKTIFDYEVDEKYPPCANFLENFLETKVLVFSLPVDHSLFSQCNLKDLYEQKILKDESTPKNVSDKEFVVGWIGIERNHNLSVISNIQINGTIFKFLSRPITKKLYRNFIKYAEEEIEGTILIPTHETLRKLISRLRYHPRSSIMETPYTSEVVKGYKKENFIIDGPCRQYLSEKEMIFWTKRHTKLGM